MSVVQHQLWLYNPTGTQLDLLQDGNFAALSYALKENEPGVLELVLPGDYDVGRIFIDGQIEVYRSYARGTLKLEGETAFFIRKVNWATDENKVKTLHITAYSALGLMQRRIVAYYAGTSYAEKIADHWDDMLREIVDENYGPGASYGGDPDRNLEPWLVVEADAAAGASYVHSFPWRVVLNVLQDIVNDVRSHGTYCTFDVVRIGPAAFEFRVFIGPRGVDHSSVSGDPVIVSLARGNLSTPSVEADWTDEHNYIYGTGQGQNDARVIQTAQDDVRIGISPFNRQEFNRDARMDELPESVLAEANTALEEFRPRINFTGMITQTPGCLYGVNWAWGDIVTAEYEGNSFDCHVDAISVTIDESGTEIVTGMLRSVTDV